MSDSLIAADRMIHVKIVVVALIASISVIAAGVYARPTKARWKSTRLNSSHIQKSRMPSSA